MNGSSISLLKLLLKISDSQMFMLYSSCLCVCLLYRSYYESNDLPSALSVIEEALARHPTLVSDDFINMAAELYISSRQYNKALQVRHCVPACVKECVCVC